MAEAIEPPPVKLVMGLLFAIEAPIAAVRRQLEADFGRIDLETTLLPFVWTRFYEREMGPALQRQFWSFETLIAAAALADIKRQTNAMERTFAGHGGQRRVNLDPGYIDQAKLVLATTKDRQHRLYLSRHLCRSDAALYRRPICAVGMDLSGLSEPRISSVLRRRAATLSPTADDPDHGALPCLSSAGR